MTSAIVANPPDIALTVEEAAHTLRIGRTSMYALIRDGHVKTIKVYGSRRVPVSALQQYVSLLLTTTSHEEGLS